MRSHRSGTLGTLIACAFGLGFALTPAGAAGQVVVGAHAVHAADAFGGATGIGARAGIDLPVLPFAGFASAEKFFPDCPAEADDCSLSGFTLEANFEMTLPVVQPYGSVGIAWRDFSSNGVDETDTGLALGAGVGVGLGRFTAFGEGRYEFLEAPERQFLIRIGLLLDAF